MSFIFMTLLGYITHKIFHKKWSGRFYRAHFNHHYLQYPPEDLISDKYRDAGKDNTVYLFALCFSPFIIGNIILTILGIIPIILGVGIFIEMAVVSLLNSELHDAFHLTNSFWHKFWFFDNLKKLHFQHHFDQSKNYGIFSFMWDKIFRTYRNN
jgi:sterol desaturase/sphingolipid hydroxylase (fatty acid hydroxylase superfamily)